jgi:hypothetical protein
MFISTFDEEFSPSLIIFGFGSFYFGYFGFLFLFSLFAFLPSFSFFGGVGL